MLFVRSEGPVEALRGIENVRRVAIIDEHEETWIHEAGRVANEPFELWRDIADLPALGADADASESLSHRRILERDQAIAQTTRLLVHIDCDFQKPSGASDDAAHGERVEDLIAEDQRRRGL